MRLKNSIISFFISVLVIFNVGCKKEEVVVSSIENPVLSDTITLNKVKEEQNKEKVSYKSVPNIELQSDGKLYALDVPIGKSFDEVSKVYKLIPVKGSSNKIYEVEEFKIFLLNGYIYKTNFIFNDKQKLEQIINFITYETHEERDYLFGKLLIGTNNAFGKMQEETSRKGKNVTRLFYKGLSSTSGIYLYYDMLADKSNGFIVFGIKG